MTTCLAHPDRPSCATCHACGADLCAACEIRAHETAWCEPCLAARLHASPPPPSQAPPPGILMPVKSAGLAALFSLFVPGLGTVYCFNGFARRALVQFATWALLLWCFGHASGFLAFLLFVAGFGFYIWQAVDAYGTAMTFNALGRVPGEDEAAAMGKGPYLIHDADSRSLGAALLVAGIVMLGFELGGVLLSGLRWLLPFAVIGLGVWVVARARRNPPPVGSANGAATAAGGAP